MKRKSSRSGLFLIELIIVILFFSVSSAICMKIFATAYLSNQYSRALSKSAEEISNISSIYKNSEGELEKTAEMLDAKYSANEIVYSIGEDLTVKITENENEKYLKSINIIIYENEKELNAATIVYAHEAAS